jgi:hypothetical protein
MSNMTDPFNWQLGQLFAAARREPDAQAPRFNPRPAGVIQQGSATDAVLHFLRANRGRYFSRVEIIVATRRSEKSVDWALIFLRREGLADCIPDDRRNPRYLRHGANTETAEVAIRIRPGTCSQPAQSGAEIEPL